MNQKIYNLMSAFSFFLLFAILLSGAGNSDIEVKERLMQDFVTHDDAWVVGKIEVRDTDRVTVLGGWKTESGKQKLYGMDAIIPRGQTESTIPETMKEDGSIQYRTVPTQVSIGGETRIIPANSWVQYAYGVPIILDATPALEVDLGMMTYIGGEWKKFRSWGSVTGVYQ
jgi:hypothetical protein